MDEKRALKVFETPDLMSIAVADFIVQSAVESIAARGRFVISLSGGNTPNKVYSLLSSPSYKDQIDWTKTFIFWGDERCVPLNDERNNAHTARTVMLDKIDIAQDHIYPIQVQLPPAEAANAYEQMLKDFFVNEAPCFDLILLGLGENGHTASLFPGTPVIHESQRWVKEVYVADQKEWRITMTAPLINQARKIAFLVAGKPKAGVLQAVLKDSLHPDKYPAQLIKPANGHLYWFADQDATSRI
jgi:6-phosphogluconolactonase